MEKLKYKKGDEVKVRDLKSSFFAYTGVVIEVDTQYGYPEYHVSWSNNQPGVHEASELINANPWNPVLKGDNIGSGIMGAALRKKGRVK